MDFIIILACTFILVIAFIFLTVPTGKDNNAKQSHLADAENTNSGDKADERYLLLYEAGINGTYLKKIREKKDGKRNEKRL